MSVSSSFVAVAGLTLVGACSGTVASILVLSSIVTPLPFKLAVFLAAPFGLVSYLALRTAIRL